MRIDFGGIAKGFAADEALRVLAEHGCNRSLVDASGDIVAGDPPPCSDAWVVSIESLRRRSMGSESPEQEVGRSQEDQIDETIPMLRICNQAVATSGDAYQSVLISGRRYSHIVDPKTGLGLNQRSSVTIVAPTGMMADALASAASVLGPSAGIELLEEPGRCDTEGYVMFAKGESDEVRTVTSSGLSQFLIREPHEK
jgi:thiamine biosynthesis lipoprotein